MADAVTSFFVRRATPNDKEELTKLIHDSARRLSTNQYTDTQIKALIEGVFGVDSALVADGTYFAVEEHVTGRLIGCGGWSRRKTLFGGDQYSGREDVYVTPGVDPAKVRALFVHPDCARSGVGTAILERCEREAAESGFTVLELMSTMPGVAFYERHGYTPITLVQVHQFLGVDVELLPMRKTTSPQ